MAENSEIKWYVVHTYSGYENKVKVNLEKSVENNGLQDKIVEVCIPVEEAVEIKNNKRRTVQHKLLPGYVLVKMLMNEETWYIVRNTRGVTGFVGPGSKPVPLTPDEMRPLGIGSGKVESAPKQKYLVDFEKDDMVVVIAGAWKDTEGLVTDINAQRQTVTINVDLFGRETPVEISFADVKKK
jgi:transcriptional antiterminator NusG